MWRMKQLISEGKIETMGNVDGGWKEFDVRNASQQAKDAEVSEETLNTQ